MKSRPTASDSPWAKLDAMIAKMKPPTGPEWFSIVQYCERYGCPRTTANHQLHKMVETGVLEIWQGGTAGAGKVVRYRLINKAKTK